MFEQWKHCYRRDTFKLCYFKKANEDFLQIGAIFGGFQIWFNISLLLLKYNIS